MGSSLKFIALYSLSAHAHRNLSLWLLCVRIQKNFYCCPFSRLPSAYINGEPENNTSSLNFSRRCPKKIKMERFHHIREFTKTALLVFSVSFLMLLSHRNAYADYAILTDQQLKGGLNYSLSETADLTDHILQTPQSHLKYIRAYWYDLYIGSYYTYEVPADGQQCNIIMYSDNMTNSLQTILIRYGWIMKATMMQLKRRNGMWTATRLSSKLKTSIVNRWPIQSFHPYSVGYNEFFSAIILLIL